MKIHSFFYVALFGFTSVLPAQRLYEIPTILEQRELLDDGGTVQRFLWRTDPGVRYLLKTSIDLKSWSDVAGFPREAEGPVDFFDFTPAAEASGVKNFFQAFRIDE